MITNASVTIFHFDEKTGIETATEYKRANVHGDVKIGDLSHGRRSETRFTIRIPTNEKIEISCGDKIECEKFLGRLTVAGFADNRRSSRYIRHWKILVR